MASCDWSRHDFDSKDLLLDGFDSLCLTGTGANTVLHDPTMAQMAVHPIMPLIDPRASAMARLYPRGSVLTGCRICRPSPAADW